MKLLNKSLISLIAAIALLASGLTFAKKPEGTTIVGVASAINLASMTEEDPDGEFAVLLLAAGLYPDIVDYLSGKGQRTLFAPTDAAFANLAEILPMFCYNDGLVDFVLDQPDYIADVLLYHVTKGRKDAASVLPKDRIRMLSGDFVTRMPNSLVITDALGRDANLLQVDVAADNGLIHVISEVILPYPPASACSS